MLIIKNISKVIDGNVCEAEKYINKAYKAKDTNKALAEWYRDMASAHINFNTPGHAIVAKLIEAETSKIPPSEFSPGMLMLWEDMHAELTARTAEVKAMIDNFNK